MYTFLALCCSNCFRFPTQHTVQPAKSNLVAVANSGASKGGMMSSRTAGNGRERASNSGRPARSSNAASPSSSSSSGVQCMLCGCELYVYCMIAFESNHGITGYNDFMHDIVCKNVMKGMYYVLLWMHFYMYMCYAEILTTCTCIIYVCMFSMCYMCIH